MNQPDSKQTVDYHNLSPDIILNAIEHQGYQCDGRMLALNSYENRVYQIGIEDASPIVAKFYRPHRWTNEAIIEEHIFSQQLFENDIPVVAPLQHNGETLLQFDDFRFSLFANKGGRAPDLEDFDLLEQLGRFMGRIHQTGKSKAFEHRPELNIETFGHQPQQYILKHNFIPPELLNAYQTLTDDLLKNIELCYQRAGDIQLIRTHGDCHPSNILWTDSGPHIVDFDDARMAPAVQDLWMFLSGDRADMTAALDALLTGYTEFCEFNGAELHLIEALRTLRLIHYYGWLAKRWDDPAFKRAFPWFDSQQCWEQHILNLREQSALLHEEPLQWMG